VRPHFQTIMFPYTCKIRSLASLTHSLKLLITDSTTLEKNRNLTTGFRFHTTTHA
jgi:hypothetical protein